VKKVVQYVQKELKTLPSEFAAWEHGTRSTNFDAESPNDRVEQVPPAIEIRSLAPVDDATAFRTLNEEWITQYFTLEAKDREILDDPVKSILQKGGHIFMAYAGVEAVGCVALIPMKDGVYELSKMAVSPHLRGRGLGRRLLQHAIAQAKCLSATSLFLGSNTRLKDAVHLYESVGFRHVKPESLPPMPYSRADVFMEMSLGEERKEGHAPSREQDHVIDSQIRFCSTFLSFSQKSDAFVL